MTSTETSTGDFFSRLSARTQHIICLSVLFIVPFILFFQTTLGGKELQRHDITQWRAGAESIIEYREEFGEEPLWASNMFAGMPAYVISLQTQVRHIDFIQGYFNKIYPAFPYWIMLTGMYFLLILMGFRPLSALAGSLTFGLSTYFSILVIAGHTSKLMALSYVPWIFAGYWLMAKKEGALWKGLLIFVVAFSLEIRSGHPQITYYFMFLLGGLWIHESWSLIKEKAYQNWALLTGLLVLAGILGILSNAERMLTLQEYAEYSIRGGSAIKETTALDVGYAFAWSQGIKESLTLLIPNLYGGASPEYFGPKSFTSGPHYLGAVALPFILIGLLKVRQKMVYVFFGVGTLGMFFAWGENFELLNRFAFNVIPFFSKFRAPETWMVLPVFCYTIVMVFGLNWLFDQVKSKSLSLKSLYTPLGLTLGIFFMLFLFTTSMDYTKPGEVENIATQIAQQNQVSPQNPQVLQQAQNYVNTRLVAPREEKSTADVLRLGLFLIITSGLIYLVTQKKLTVTNASLLLILLVAFDLIQVGKRYMPEGSFVASNVSPERYIESQERDTDRYIQEHISDGSAYPYRVLPLLRSTFSDAVPSYFYPTLGGYTGARLSVSSDVLMGDDNLIFSGPSGINIDLLRLLNTKYITYSQGLNIDGLNPVFQGQSGVVYEIEGVYPKAFFVDSIITAGSPQEAYNYLRPGRIDFRSTAIVEATDVSSQPDSASGVEVVSYTGPEMVIKLDRSEPGFLVLSEVFYPEGWVAELNGEQIPMLKTNYMLRGFEIPAGQHELTLDFRPDSFYTGVKLSWFSLISQILLACVVGFTYINQKRKSE